MFCHKNKPFPFCLSKKMQQEQAGAALKKVAPANKKIGSGSATLDYLYFNRLCYSWTISKGSNKYVMHY